MGYLDDIAADKHFYSPPDRGSLDDAITRYENKLANRFKLLKKAKIGAFADSALPAEMAAHLTVRTESMRTGFGYAAKQMALKTLQTFQDDEIIKRMLNLDDDVPGSRFKGVIADLLKAQEENLKAIGLSPASAERVAFLIAKEQFPKLTANLKPRIAAVSASLYHKAEELAASAQRKVLSQSMAPEQRVVFLKSLLWEIVSADEPAILPDCVAIALQSNGSPLPLLLADSEKIEVVVFPLDHKRLLVGRKTAAPVFRPFMYNVHAISCSETFFVSSVRSQKLEHWSKFIGVVPKSTMHEFLKGAFDEYQAPALPPRREPDPPYSIKITFKDATDQEAVKTAGEKINAVTDWAVARFSLDRIDEIIFTRPHTHKP